MKYVKTNWIFNFFYFSVTALPNTRILITTEKDGEGLVDGSLLLKSVALI